MKKYSVLSLTLIFLIGIGACTSISDINPAPATADTLLAAGGTPTAPPQSDLPVSPTAPSTPSVAPPPTLVPLPETCLREPFATDVRNCGAISHYDIALTVDVDAARVTGRQEVRYTNQEDGPLSSLYLQLLPNSSTYGGTMTVTNTTLAGRAVTPTFELEGAAMRLALEPSLAVSGTITMTMDFAVDVPTSSRTGHGLFSYWNGVMALPHVHPLIPVYDEEGWNIELPPEHADEIYADVAAYEVRITAPSSLQLIASGTCTSEESGGEQAIWSCEAAPMRDFNLILGQFEQRNRMVNGVVVNSYFYPGDEAGGEKALQVAIDALSAFTDLFGPYTYTELDVVQTPNYLGGMEYSGLVVLEDSLYPSVVGVEWLTAHEVAHQWWFAMVGNDQVDDPWLDEALTQYSTLLYYEEVYGPERAEAIRYSQFEQVNESLIQRGRNLPIGMAADEYSSGLYWEIVYDKGALYFHNLREAVGDEVFFDIMRTYYRRHKYEIATPESFLDTVEDVSGDRYEELFEEWVVGGAGE